MQTTDVDSDVINDYLSASSVRIRLHEKQWQMGTRKEEEAADAEIR